MWFEGNDVKRQFRVLWEQLRPQAPALSWVELVGLLMLAFALVACGSNESRPSTTVPTASPTPSSSSTPQPSETPTASPTPPPATPEILVQDHSDGSKSFIDHKVGYTITFPSGWLILEMTGGRNDAIFTAAAKEYPDLEDRIAILSLTSPNIRIFALSADPDFLALESPPIVGVLLADAPSSPSLDFMLDASAQALSRFLEAEILSSERTTNSKGVSLGIVKYRFGSANEVDFLASTFGQATMFYIDDVLVTVTGSANQALKDQLEPVFDNIFDTIELVGS